MPEIARFFGIVITMYHREHGAQHFHARCGDHKISVDLATLVVHERFPPIAQRLVLEWASRHRAELFENWNRSQRRLPLKRIESLE